MSQYCTVCEPEEFQLLKELANLQGGSPREKKKMGEKTKEIAQRRWKAAQERLKQYREKLRKREEALYSAALEQSLEGKDSQELAQMITGDKERQDLKDQITSLELETREVTPEDQMDLLKEYEKEGYIKFAGGRLQITSRGAQLLGRGFLMKILKNLTKRGVGTHQVEELGYGSKVSRSTRPYDLGDTYDRINIEKTFLNTLERGKGINEFGVEDIQIYEPFHQSKLNIGIIVDESGSMRTYGRYSYRNGYLPGGAGYKKKIDAAIETALALTELIRTNYPQDKIRVFTFSEQVKEIPPWDIVNITVPGRSTNIRAGLRAYRITVAREEGDKQAYLITDTEPNFENGRHVGFRKAARGVLNEATRYRKENITLNIVMLDQSYQLKEFARRVAKQNVGRVIFTSPEKLGDAILEDYLTSKRERLLYS